MTGPAPLSDRDLDRLLSHGTVPAASATLADRIVAEAQRADRIPTPASRPAPRRAARRPWSRRTMIAGILAINLFAASAIAAAFGGDDGLRRVSTFSSHVFHAIAAAMPHHRLVMVHPVSVRPALKIERPPQQAEAQRPAVVGPATRVVPVEPAPPRRLIAQPRAERFRPAGQMRREPAILRERHKRQLIAAPSRRAEAVEPKRTRRMVGEPSRPGRRFGDRVMSPIEARPAEASGARSVEPIDRPAVSSKPREERPALEDRQRGVEAEATSGLRDSGQERSRDREWHREDQSGPRNRRGGFRQRRRRR